MMSPEFYRKQIQDLEIEGKEIFPENGEEAIILFDELQNIEKILKHIKYNIRIDIRIIRKDYMNKIREIRNSSKFKRRSDKRSLKNKINKKKQLIDEKDLKIAPYEYIEYIIDDYLRQIKISKSYVIDYLKKL